MSRSYDRTAILERDDYICQHCGFDSDGDGRPLEVAHRVAVADGGPSDDWNLLTLCIGCHSDYDGWNVGDFGDSGRLRRAASYVLDRNDGWLSDDRFVSEVCELTSFDGTEREMHQMLADIGFMRPP